MSETKKEPEQGQPTPPPQATPPVKTTAIEKMNKFFRSPQVKERFMEVLGKQNAGPYLGAVMIAYAANPKLADCTLPSVFHSAMRAASLRLSVDPSTGQAHLVPFKDKCTLIVGYKGLYDMAVRTEKYTFIQVNQLYEGETFETDRLTGVSRLGGGKVSNKVIGWLGVFQMRSGMHHELYMTLEEIHDHAKHYSKSYDYSDSVWKTNPEAMERKTVLRLLLRRYGYLDPVDMIALEAAETGEQEDEEDKPEVIDLSWSELSEEPKTPKTEAEIMGELGYKTNKPGKDEQKAKETPINAAIHTFRDLQERANGLGLAVDPLPEKVTIEVVRKAIDKLTKTIVEEELKKVDSKATQGGLAL